MRRIKKKQKQKPEETHLYDDESVEGNSIYQRQSVEGNSIYQRQSIFNELNLIKSRVNQVADYS